MVPGEGGEGSGKEGGWGKCDGLDRALLKVV
jgi:hypothetical protein